MFIIINGPLLHLWKSEVCVKLWLVCHRSADNTRSKKVKRKIKKFKVFGMYCNILTIQFLTYLWVLYF